MIELTINGQVQQVDVEPETPLLWVLRDTLGLTGTRFGCGIGQCGACTVHLNGGAVRSCSLPVGSLSGAQVKTIEGLGADVLHPLQQAWIEESVPQCGYCQSGQLMAAAALLALAPNTTEEQLVAGMTNICRCATYHRIKRAFFKARDQLLASQKTTEVNDATIPPISAPTSPSTAQPEVTP
ncbi:MAG: (2Fe-2S)-binding protein [Myxococcota bacterium]